MRQAVLNAENWARYRAMAVNAPKTPTKQVILIEHQGAIVGGALLISAETPILFLQHVAVADWLKEDLQAETVEKILQCARVVGRLSASSVFMLFPAPSWIPALQRSGFTGNGSVAGWNPLAIQAPERAGEEEAAQAESEPEAQPEPQQSHEPVSEPKRHWALAPESASPVDDELMREVRAEMGNGKGRVAREPEERAG